MLAKNLSIFLIAIATLGGCSNNDASLSSQDISPHMPYTVSYGRSNWLGLGASNSHPLVPPPAGIANIPNAAQEALKRSQTNNQTSPVDPDALAAARKIQEITHSEQIFVKLLDARIGVLKMAVITANPTAGNKIGLLFQEVLLQRFEQLVPAFIDQNAQAMARHFSAEELDQIAEFYSSPLGIKLTAAMPAIQQETLAAMQPVIFSTVTEFIKVLRQKAAARGVTIPHNI